MHGCTVFGCGSPMMGDFSSGRDLAAQTTRLCMATVVPLSCQRRFSKCITTISTAGITRIAIWRRFIVTVTTVRSEMVRMTKADLHEEPCARKPARTVLQTSGGSDPFTEFNRQLRQPVQWLKTSRGTASERTLAERMAARPVDGAHTPILRRGQRYGPATSTLARLRFANRTRTVSRTFARVTRFCTATFPRASTPRR